MTGQGTEHLKATVATNIDHALAASGWTNREVALKIGASEAQVSKWRRGTHGISQQNLIPLALALGYPVAWFYIDHDREAA